MLKSNVDQTPEMQGAVANEVNTRLRNAVEDLKAKYESGKGGLDESVNGPTGAVYKDAQKQKAAQKAKAKSAAEQSALRVDNGGNEMDEDEEDVDEDNEIRRLRDKRLQEMKRAEQARSENIAKGHGEYREIVQDEFLKEMTNSDKVICHFFHQDFPRCKIMDHHLRILAQRHIETKFVCINAERAPFFVEKLKIRTMPSVIFFVDGVATGKLIGFEGLSDGLEEGKEDEWRTIKLARLLGKNGMINKDSIVDDDAEKAAVEATIEQMRRQAFVGYLDEDYDLEISDSEN